MANRTILSNLIGLSDQQFIGFLLVFIRISALLSVAPILGSQVVPVRIKVFLALFMSIVFLPMIKTDQRLASLTLSSMAPRAIKEALLGLFLGFNSKFIFEGFQFAGRLISTQMGLGMANLIDPDSGAPVTALGNIYSMVAIVLFLSLNGHHLVIEALYKSFDISSVTDLSLVNPAAQTKMLTMFNDLFVIGIKLAAPSMAALFLIEVCMGIMARIVPQMNIFFIGLPVRLGIGLFIVIASLPVFYVFFLSVLRAWKLDLSSILSYF